MAAQEILRAGGAVVATDLYHRFNDHLLARVMATTLRVPRLDAFESPELARRADQATQVVRYGPGQLISGLSYKWTCQAQGYAAAALAGYVNPVAAVVLVVMWTVVGRHLRADFRRADPSWAEPLRRAAYLKRISLMPDWAKELRIFGLTGWLVARFSGEWAQVMAEAWRTRRIGYRKTALLMVAIVSINLAVVIWATQSTLGGELTVGSLTILIQALFGMALLAAQDGDLSVENGAIPVPDILEYEQEAALHAPATIPKRSAADMPSREIKFEQVRFGYCGRDLPVFDGLDLTIESGRSLAIVGLNGAGKTTLIKLLTGLTVPNGGRISVDGIDLAELDATSWRRQLGAIFQDFVQYQLTLRDNIGFGAIESLHTPQYDAQLLAAARRAGAGPILDQLPAGLDTVLSRRYDGGVDLSGGQWQRIALARAMAAVGGGARVLVLDEPTAQLDVRAEADLYDRFLDITEGLTSIVISHRFSTVRRADRIVVLEAGRIVEEGSHDDLVAAGNRYSTLFHNQAMRYSSTADITDQMTGTDDHA